MITASLMHISKKEYCSTVSGQFTEALATFEKARAISNTNADAYFWTGKTLRSIKQSARSN
jgi:hypothetical protein